MTAQASDILILRGNRHQLCTLPLHDYLKRRPKRSRPRFCVPSTALWRGYIATWEIRDDALWLISLEADVNDNETVRPAAFQDICRKWKPPVRASWFTGDLRCPEGGLLSYAHHGFASIYERDRMIWIERGQVVGEQLHINPPNRVIYTIAPDGTRLFDPKINQFDHLDHDLYAPDETPRGERFWQAEAQDLASKPDEDGLFLAGYTSFR